MKKLTVRILALALALVMLAGLASTALAASNASKISSIMLDYSLTNSRADSAVQQSVNGLYRSVELLELIAKKWD